MSVRGIDGLYVFEIVVVMGSLTAMEERNLVEVLLCEIGVQIRGLVVGLGLKMGFGIFRVFTLVIADRSVNNTPINSTLMVLSYSSYLRYSIG